jgi:hypothetical protein
MTSRNTINVDPLSARSLLLQLEVNGNSLGTATGFIVEQNQQPYLITNWHVLSGRNAETNESLSLTGALPDSVRIFHHDSSRLGTWIAKVEKLYKNDTPLWIDHEQGRNIDVVALPLTELGDEVRIYSLDLRLADVDMATSANLKSSE